MELIELLLSHGASAAACSLSVLFSSDRQRDPFLLKADMDRVRDLLGGQKADIVLSDMAASSTGHKATDHLRIVALIEISLDFAHEVLVEGGWFVVKILQGGAQGELQRSLGQCFDKVRVIKPPASRSDSSEAYVAASGYRPAERESSA